MKIHHSFDNLNIKNAVVTTGSFDGVHIGHKVIIDRLKELAKEVDGESVLITFHPHPRKVLYPDTQGRDLKLINSQSEKIELLRKTGLDHLIIIDFTLDFAKTTSDYFVNNILLDKLNAKVIVVGFNHHFGHNRKGDYNYLYELTKTRDFKVEEIPEQDIQNETVSSTKIRKALKEGRIQRANAYLDHQYIVTGSVMEINMAGASFKSFLINKEDETKLFPQDGYYAVSVSMGSFYSKALGYVCTHCKRSLNVFFEDTPELKTNDKVIVLFQKELSLNLNGEGNIQKNSDILKGLELVNDLIY